MSERADAPDLDRTGALAVSLAAAQAYNRVLSAHFLGLIGATRAKGAPDEATLIRACEIALQKAFDASSRARSDAERDVATAIADIVLSVDGRRR